MNHPFNFQPSSLEITDLDFADQLTDEDAETFRGGGDIVVYPTPSVFPTISIPTKLSPTYLNPTYLSPAWDEVKLPGYNFPDFPLDS